MASCGRVVRCLKHSRGCGEKCNMCGCTTRCNMKLACAGMLGANKRRRSAPEMLVPSGPENITTPTTSIPAQNKRKQAVHQKEHHKAEEKRKEKTTKISIPLSQRRSQRSSHSSRIQAAPLHASAAAVKQRSPLDCPVSMSRSSDLSQYHLSVTKNIVELSILPLLPLGEFHDDICAECYSQGQTDVVEGESVICCSFCNEVYHDRAQCLKSFHPARLHGEYDGNWACPLCFREAELKLHPDIAEVPLGRAPTYEEVLQALQYIQVQKLHRDNVRSNKAQVLQGLVLGCVNARGKGIQASTTTTILPRLSQLLVNFARMNLPGFQFTRFCTRTTHIYCLYVCVCILICIFFICMYVHKCIYMYINCQSVL